jgi:single-strand DNA-binding protein
MYNKVILVGNLTRDPETKTSSVQVCNFTLAVNENKETLFIDIVAFDKLADTCGQYLNKGKKVLVEGRLKMNEWTGKDGSKKSKIEVVASKVVFLSPRGSSGIEDPF